MLEYAAEQLLPAGSSPAALGPVLERLVSAFAAQGALVIAPGSARPVGADGAGDILDDLVLLAQVRTAWAARGSALSAGGQPFETDLDSGQRRTGLLVVPAASAGREPACALALLGQTSRWKTGARATLRALATIIGTLPSPAADPASPPASAMASTASSPTARTATATAGPGPASAVEPGPAAADTLAAALVAGAPTAIVAVDADRRIREFNPSAEALFGRRRADTLGLDMPETLVPERFRQLFVDAMAGYLATGDRSGFSRRVRLRALRADGTDRTVELTPTPVTVGGHTYFFGFLRDASELEEATRAVAEGEARFRLLSEIAPVGIVQSDPDGIVRFVNDKWSEMSGIPAAEVIGKSWRSTIHPSDVARIDSLRDTSGVATELAADCRLRTASGGEKWMHVEVRRITGSAGELVGRVTALTDVNDRMLMEEAVERDRRRLSAQNDELRSLNDERVRYLATVSHELRTPLTSIVSFAELIRSEDSELDEDSAEYLDIIQRNAERLLRMVGELVELQGLEEGVSRLDLAPISVPTVARESVRSGWATAAVDGVSLDIVAQDGPAVQADSGRIQQVLDNLISNAVKFSPTGGRVEVRATHTTSEWRIDVADTGMGIPASEVDHLFDRFFRASNARETRVPGSGLGLPTAKAITELHGGRIEVASVVGTGTTFSVYLPIGR
ncbi:MAG: PAS domain-containing sensor histidine kinase [Streptosporangiaceae bacterium]